MLYYEGTASLLQDVNVLTFHFNTKRPSTRRLPQILYMIACSGREVCSVLAQVRLNYPANADMQQHYSPRADLSVVSLHESDLGLRLAFFGRPWSVEKSYPLNARRKFALNFTDDRGWRIEYRPEKKTASGTNPQHQPEPWP